MASFGYSQSKKDPAKVWGAQSGYLTDLFERSQTAGQDPNAMDYSQSFLDPAKQGWQSLMAGNQFNTAPLQDIASGTTQNTNLMGAIQAGQDQIGRNLQRNILPSISAGSVANGTSGGSRQGIASGLAMSDANQQSTDFMTNMLSNNYQSGIANQLNAFSGMGNLQNVQNQGITSALQQTNPTMNLGWDTQFNPLRAEKDIYGNPTVLSGGGSSYSMSGSNS